MAAEVWNPTVQPLIHVQSFADLRRRNGIQIIKCTALVVMGSIIVILHREGFRSCGGSWARWPWGGRVRDWLERSHGINIEDARRPRSARRDDLFFSSSTATSGGIRSITRSPGDACYYSIIHNINRGDHTIRSTREFVREISHL